MPVRLIDGGLIIVALSDPAHAHVFEVLQELHAEAVHFVLADAEQIRQMIERYFI